MLVPAQIRVGQGFDVHPFAEGRRLVLGGVEIDHPLGLEGHSDADVLAHAISDALLGAGGLGDIGQHFPDTDDAYKDADSMHLLHRVGRMLDEAGWRVINIDATLMAQAPRLSPYFPRMKAALDLALGLDPDRISLKATTTERMGFVGRGEGIAALAVALISRKG